MKNNQPPKELSMSAEEIRILKTGSCLSVSGRSTLTYHIGCKADRTVHIRIIENTGAGLFSKEWTAIDPLLSSEEKAVTSGSLHALFKGKSANSAGFLLAVLINEGLINIVNEKPRKYERADPEQFNTSIQALMDLDTASADQKKPTKVKDKKKEEPNPENQS